MKDLALIVADKNMDFAMRGILSRTDALGIRPIVHEMKTHSGRDGGVRTSGPEMLASLRREFSHGIIMLDLAGSGTDENSAEKLEATLDLRLAPHWNQDAKAIVIAPELDAWMWGSDNAIRDVYGWNDDLNIRAWLGKQGFKFNQDGKPELPKEAIEAMMIQLKEPRSSALYEKLTKKVSLQRCKDPAFNRLKVTLKAWFG